MSYTGGIDSQLRDTQDGIMSGTRQPLDNRLLDVLALQNIKVRQEEAKQKLLTSMEGEEGTVADQLTNEVINNEKEKLQGGIADVATRAKQVGGVNNQQAARQQQNMQRVAQQGVATQPAPNMARMAGGGIVTFAGPDGSLVDMPSDEQLSRIGLTKEQWVRMSPRERDAKLPRRAYEQSPTLGQIGTWIKDQFTPRKKIDRRITDPIAGPWRGDVDDPGAQSGPIKRTSIQPPASAPFRQTADFGGLSSAPGARPIVPPINPSARLDPLGGLGGDLSGLHSLLGSKQVPAGQATTGQATTTQRKTDAQGAEAARGKAVDWAGGVLNREGHAAQRADMLRRLQEDNRTSKEEREYWALNDMLARAGGQGALSNIARGAADMRTAARREDKADLARELGLEEKGIKGDVDIAKAQVTAGTAASKAALEKSARDTLNSIKKKQVAATSATAKEKLFVDITKAIAKIKQENSADVEKRISENVNMFELRQAAMNGNTEAIAKVKAFEKKAREEAYTEVSATLIELERLRESVSKQLSGWGRPNISQQQQPQRQ
jgi:hypothetical protein